MPILCVKNAGKVTPLNRNSTASPGVAQNTSTASENSCEFRDERRDLFNKATPAALTVQEDDGGLLPGSSPTPSVPNKERYTRVQSAVRKTMSSPGRLLATYPLLPSFEYCERLDCYVDRLDLLDASIAPPHPPPTKKVDIFYLPDYDDVDDRAINAPMRFLNQTLKDLVTYLIEGYDDDLAKIRVIYRWITCQPIDMIPMRKEPLQSHAVFQLWRIKNKKGNYAQLVSLLCRYADIPCVIVHGTLKGSTYEVGDEIDEDRHYGEWNAVLIDGHWRFINAYWGTCAEGATDERTNFTGAEEDAPNRMYYCCDENYFLTDPDQVVATHLPKSPKWQLKAKPVSSIEFEQMTFVKDRYFNLKLRTVTHNKCVIHNDTGEVEIKFGVPQQKSLNIDFQYLLFRLKGSSEKRVDRYVFMHRTNSNEHLTVRIRAPEPCVMRFELVGKDTTIKDEGYDYDWIAIYKIIFTRGAENSQPFPPPPSIGWGPGRVAIGTGLVPLSHFTGEVFVDDYGKAEIKFGAAEKEILGDMMYSAKVYSGGEKMTELENAVVHRVEDGDVIFHVMTPKRGEYVLRVFAKDLNSDKVREFCDYLVLSKQVEENGQFPKGFQTRLGPKAAFVASGLSPIIPSGFIKTDQDKVNLGFKRKEDIELSVNFSGEKLKPAEAPLLLSQQEAGNMVTYTVRLPETGVFGVKIRGTREEGAPHEPVYDYVIDYRKPRRRTKKDPTISQEAVSNGTEGEKPHDEPPTEDHAPEENAEDSMTDVLRRRLRLSVEESNHFELKRVLNEMRRLQLASVEPDIKYGEEELQFIQTKKELLIAIRDKDSHKLKKAMRRVKAGRYETRLGPELKLAKNLQIRLKKLARLLHAVLDLDGSTIAEIRGYSAPPPIVHTVMRATLLLLGHWEEETCKWKNIQTVLGKTGKESLKRLISEFKIDHCPLEVALGAKDYLRDYSIEQVRLVSAGCATFYIWVKGVVEELEQRAGEEINNIRPRTSQGKGRKKIRNLTFLRDLEETPE